MQTVVLVIALWLILVGIYGALSLLRGDPRPARPRAARRSKARQAPEKYAVEQDAPSAILSEVDLLRAQVRHLRSEIFAMNGTAPEPEKTSKPKRYRGQTELPRPLRRHLRETRGVRTA